MPPKRSSTRPSPRRRGAQPGNHNALKHGFYSSLFRRADLLALPDQPVAGLLDEIDLLRLIVFRLSDLAEKSESEVIKLRLYSAATLALYRLRGMVHTHHTVFQPDSDIALLITRAINDVGEELHMYHT